MRDVNTKPTLDEIAQARPQRFSSRPDYDRQQEHTADGLKLLDYLLTFPQNTPDDRWRSTAELQEMKIFGLRPVNRLVDARKGRYRNHCYDIEGIKFQHGTYRWRLHWPNRPGHPKHKQQTFLNLSGDERQTGRERPAGETRHARAERFSREFGLRPASHPWKPAFSDKRLADPDCFTLTPPEPRQ